LKFINENALPAIQAFSAAFSLTEGDGFGRIVSDVGETLKKTFTPSIEGVKKVFDNVKSAVMDSKDEFSAFWDVVKFIAPLIGSAIGDALNVIGKIANVVITVIGKVLGAIKPLLNTAIDGINLIIKGYNLVQFGKDIPLIPKIGASSGSTETGALGNFSMSTGAVSQTPEQQAQLAAAVKAGEAEAKIIVAGQAKGLTAAQSLAAAAAASTSNVVSSNFNPGTFREGEAATSGATFNINVSGALDKEGTAREIYKVINDSFYRGTGGANNLQIA